MAVWGRNSLHLALVEVIWDPENSHKELPKAVVAPAPLSLWVAVLIKVHKISLPHSQWILSELGVKMSKILNNVTC